MAAEIREWSPAERQDWAYVPGAFVASAGRVRVRRYHPKDRERARWICAETGFLGRPVDPLFEDRELFADYLTSYFTDREPESTFIVEDEGGGTAGYLMGCRQLGRLAAFERIALPKLVLKGLVRLACGRYGRATRSYAWWVLTRGRKETPAAPEGWAHFHINLLPEARGIAGSRLLFDVFLCYLRDCGVAGVYGQMSSHDGRRGFALFERYGWKVTDMREVTKYRHLYPEPVHLCTISRELAGFEGLEASRLAAREASR